MPRSALACVEVDHVVSLATLGPLLYELARRPSAIDMPQPLATLRQEHAISNGGNAMQTLKAIASPSVFTCPDCGGVLFELDDKCPVRPACSGRSTQKHLRHSHFWSVLAF